MKAAVEDASGNLGENRMETESSSGRSLFPKAPRVIPRRRSPDSAQSGFTITSAKRTQPKRDAPKNRGLKLRFSSNPFNSRNAWKNIRQNPRDNTTRQAERKANAKEDPT